MDSLRKGRYELRPALDDSDLRKTQALRWQAFVACRSAAAEREGIEADDHDSRCQHMMIHDLPSGRLVGSFRLLLLAGGAQVGDSYAAGCYDLSALSRMQVPMLELGRFCIHPDCHDPDVLRLAWGALARLVDAQGIGFIFGCSSFAGTQPDRFRAAFALLNQRYLAPPAWAPGRRAERICPLASGDDGQGGDPRLALQQLPPLLRSYLAMGARVSDHAVVDTRLDTLHVFTGLEIAAIPANRAKLLRAAGA
ncbi:MULTISPECIES: GNAT family N-acetyltransferase [unclassified Paracoccus (in: a-proteobacteria)]|uniref:GNAT family N-acetyltransferase n=1 Tax=unclassified Paracoccus (in: a-proteobacteria) TaxID=2688777 RepID=UPI0012B3A060|nr:MULTISPECIES: GNAT family N-acetyltransferase [unclassified Paracoccus (in: a-proteobacteria)]UXU73999.1 GNAT family N-acetyltransferase [Paracoccus sp. SMMA_5]UXU79887.1 GNAT family N-acetyltransferase [Paracoccus sp. SMMA_5_TC]